MQAKNPDSPDCANVEANPGINFTILWYDFQNALLMLNWCLTACQHYYAILGRPRESGY